MSDLILPTSLLTGVTITREPYSNVTINESVSGKETRSSYWYGPRSRFTMEFPVLRTSESELQALLGFMAQHFYSTDSFLIQATDDSAVTAHGFGIGDGATLSFQLQRTLVSTSYDKTGGPWTVPTTQTTNHLLGSEDVGEWTLGDMSSSGNSLDPEGLFDGEIILATGASATCTQTVTGLVDVPHTFSIWLRSDDTTACTLNGGAVTISSSWARYDVQDTPAAGSLDCEIGVANTESVVFWGAQLETGSNDTLYIPTTVAAVTREPDYFPNYSDGFEPIYEIGNDVLIYEDGVAATNFSVGAYGVVTWTGGNAPTDGDDLTWTGSYYYRVKLDGEGLPFERIVDGAYKTGMINFIEVKP